MITTRKTTDKNEKKKHTPAIAAQSEIIHLSRPS
jgi:hypothetical protein